MIPLCILGMLMRFGPQHGYQIKKLIEEQMADFTQIKLPAIYYHLEKLEATALIKSTSEKDGARPEKKIFSITTAGEERFLQMLKESVHIQYRPNFDIDVTLYFADHLKKDSLIDGLERHKQNVRQSLDILFTHRDETLENIPPFMKVYAEAIFEHHICHYQAELLWVEQSIKSFKEVENR